MFDLTHKWPFGLDRKSWPDRAAAILFVLFVLVFFDVWVSLSLQAWPEVWRAPFAFVTDLGLSEWILVPTLCLFLISAIAWRVSPAERSKRVFRELTLLFSFLFVAVGLPGLITNLLKRLMGRARPTELVELGAFQFQHVLNSWEFQSFPSGHSTTAIATALVVGFLAPRFFRVVLLMAVMTGISRIVVGMHFPTDVVAGFVVGTLGAYAVRNFYATRGWLFAVRANGTIRYRGMPNLRRAWRVLLQRARP